jgi:hypothetical protein
LSVVATISLLALAAAFGLAAVAKLLDGPGTRRALGAVGVPARLVPAGAIALPLADFALAGSLVPSATARSGAGSGFLLCGDYRRNLIDATCVGCNTRSIGR